VHSFREKKAYEIRTHTHHDTLLLFRFSVSLSKRCDNIDIVVNELDAAVNINPETRAVNETLRKLTLVRLGTCGALQADIPVDSVIVSAAVLGLDGVAHFYQSPSLDHHNDMAQQFMTHVHPWPTQWNTPYARYASPTLLQHFGQAGNTTTNMVVNHGITLTANGFFGPQGRFLRLPLHLSNMNERFRTFTYTPPTNTPDTTTTTTTLRVTNYEMECSALYALGQALGHDTLTMCVAIANRYAKQFSSDYHPAVDALIVHTLDKFVSLHAMPKK
jgi:uridine phosphorylase